MTDGREILREYIGLFPDAVRPDAGIFIPSPPAAEPIDPKNTEGTKSGIDSPGSIPYIDLESRISGFPTDQQTILRALAEGKNHVDDIIAATGFSAAKVLSSMTLLVIRGAVRSHPGKRYTLEL